MLFVVNMLVGVSFISAIVVHVLHAETSNFEIACLESQPLAIAVTCTNMVWLLKRVASWLRNLKKKNR